MLGERWRHARVCHFHFSPKMRQPTDLCVRTLLCWTCNFYLCCNSLPLFHTSKASKRSMFTFQTLFCMDFEKLPALSNAKINAPNPKRFQEVLEIFAPKKTFARDSLDTAVGGGWCVGHHLALARDVVVAGERWVVVRHQAVLGGHVLGGVRAVWLGVVTLGRKCLFLMIELVTFYLGWNHGSLEVGRLIFRQCRFSPGFSSSY